MFRLAFDSVVGFSDKPLRLALWLGTIVSAGALLFGAYIFVLALTDGALDSGWASTIVVLSPLSCVNLLVIGIVGPYVGRIHAEVKNRPPYIVTRKVGFDREIASLAFGTSETTADGLRRISGAVG